MKGTNATIMHRSKIAYSNACYDARFDGRNITITRRDDGIEIMSIQGADIWNWALFLALCNNDVSLTLRETSQSSA